MTMVSHLLTDTITYKDVSSRNNSGDPSWGAAATATARVEFGPFRIQSAKGIEVDAQAKVVTETDVPHRAKVWLPGENTSDENAAHVIIRRKKASTPSASITLYELYLGGGANV